jgi:ribosomal protein L14
MNFFIKGSARIATNKKFKNMRIFRKGKKNRKGHRTRSIITRQVYLIQKNDSSSMYLNSNCCLNLKKKKILRSKYIFGPIFTNFKRKRYLSVFKLKI